MRPINRHCSSKFTFTYDIFIIPLIPEGGVYCLPLSVRPRYFSSHFSQQRFWTHQIPTSCLPILLIVIHIEHICKFFVTFFSATIDGRGLIFGHKLHIGTPYRGKRFLIHQIPSSCLPKSGCTISEH